MGADRRGPLAAFVIVALIAAILLVTSVRSQAAPWFRPTVVAGPVGEPHLWSSVTGRVDQVVQRGTVLVHQAASSTADPTRTVAQGAASQVVVSRHEPIRSATRQVAGTRQRERVDRHHPPSGTPHRLAHDGADQPPADAPTPPTAPAAPPASEQGQGSTPDGHGRHLGWYPHGHDGLPDEPSGSADPGSAEFTDTGAPGNGHGLGHAYGHDQQH